MNPTLTLIGIVMLLSVVIVVSEGDNLANVITNRTYIDNLRSSDSHEELGKFSKDYTASDKKIKILENEKTLLEIELLSPYVVSGLVGGNDIKVAEFFLINFSVDTALFDKISFFNIKNNYSSTNKNFRFKYGTEQEECFEGECFNYTTWTEFNSLTEIPFKPIKISLWANTIAKESVEWIINIKGFDILEWAAWDVSTATYLQNLSLIAQGNSPQDVFFNASGNRMYVADNANNEVDEYNLSIPWNVTTATYLQSFDTSSQEGTPTGLFFNASGNKMYVVGSSKDNVNEYDLSIPWNVTTATYLQNISISSQDGIPSGLFFNASGNRMYMVGVLNNEVHEYDLSIPWNVTSATHLQSYDMSTQEGTPRAIFFRQDGIKMYMVGFDKGNVNEYDLSIPWNVTTATYLQNFSISSQDGQPSGLFFNASGNKMYVVGYGNSKVYEYDLPPAPVDTCSCPGSGNWNVDCSDDCSITANCNIGSNLLFINGLTGSFSILANITVNGFAYQPGCIISNIPNDNKELRINAS